MNDLPATLVWLANFPATNGYVMVFIVGFASAGLITRSFSHPVKNSRLQQLRQAAGESEPSGQAFRMGAGYLQMWIYRLLALVLIASGVIGVASLVLGPITSDFIAENGESTEGVVADDMVTFTAADGTEYTLPYDFFTPATTLGRSAIFGSETAVEVHYLPDHPQAYAITAELDGAE